MIRIFRHYISGIFLGLVLLEVGVFFAAMHFGYLLRYQEMIPFRIDQLVPSAIFAVIMLISNTGMGLYQRTQTWGDAGLLLRIIGSFMMGALAMTLVFYSFPGHAIGRGIFAAAILFSLIGVTFLRVIFYRVVDQKGLKRRVVVFGAGTNAEKVIELENSKSTQNVLIVGCIPLQGQPTAVPKNRILNLKVPLNQYAMETDIDEIVVAPDDRRKGLPVDEILDCKMNGFEVVDMLTFFEREGGFIRVDCLYPSWLVFSDGFRVGFLRMFSKRLFDIIASLLLLCLAWPVMLLTALIVKIEGRFKAPVLYKQVRVGVSWQLFQVIKFRSMRTDAEQIGNPRMAQKNDSRVTRIGAFIRKTRIDELPQLFNVLKGDMSFVGPRPERPEFVERFAETIPYYSERHRVKPGITGWAQLCYPYGENEIDALNKLQYDLYYVKNYSLFFDFMIMLQTVEVVLWGKGAR